MVWVLIKGGDPDIQTGVGGGCSHKPRKAGRQQKLGGGRNRFSPDPSEESSPANTATSAY